ncbi:MULTISPECIES: hypothetical protein [Burkholderia]|uniref:hypothetical protein n=1 Tax=Burkholderia TaxID=32008 RepID=UPI0005101CFD|nr:MULTISPECIES: hypothetical protein [Burkholderia]AOJ22818.1 hypothetical protein WJ11_26125 [Burkholderia cenocepacia]KGD36062.1 hypothetical protein DO72_1488 [Burkholderia pseudomallei]KWI52508.1 hypothetical protein WT72_01790 [Burkholderia pseudomultivorans]
MRTEEDDETPNDDETDLRPDDLLANQAEVRQAIEGLYRDVSTRKRLVAVAALILRGKPHLKRQYQPEDLFQEALERIGIGLRAWPKNRVDFAGLVVGVMRSWASSLEKTKSREDDMVVMEHELASSQNDDEGPNLEETAADARTPSEHLEAVEGDAEGQSLLAILKAQYEPDQLPAKILGAIIDGSFETHEEVRSVLGVQEADYRNAWKVLMRAATKLEPKE